MNRHQKELEHSFETLEDFSAYLVELTEIENG